MTRSREKAYGPNRPGHERALIGLAIAMNGLDDLIDDLDANPPPDDDDGCHEPSLQCAEGTYFTINMLHGLLESTVVGIQSFDKSLLPALEALGLPVGEDEIRKSSFIVLSAASEQEEEVAPLFVPAMACT